jgi:hypothetical protein
MALQFSPQRIRIGMRRRPVLVDMEWQGRPRKLMLFANRNGIFMFWIVSPVSF